MASTSIPPDSSPHTRLPVSITRATTKANDTRDKLLAVDEHHAEAVPLLLNEDRKEVNNAVLMAVKVAGNRMQDELAEEREARRELQRYALIQEEAIRGFEGRVREGTRRTEVLQDEVYVEREKVKVAEERTLEADGRVCELEGEMEVRASELRASLDEMCELRGTCRQLREQVKDADESWRRSQSLADTASKKAEEAETRAREAEAQAREAEARAREAEAEKVGLVRELEQIRRKSNGLEVICKRLSKEVSDAKKETSKAKACVAETVAEKARLAAEVEESRAKLHSAETTCQRLQLNVVGAGEEIVGLREQAEQAEAARATLEDDLEQSRLQTRTLETASQEEATGINETIVDLRKRTADLEVALTQCQEQAASLQRELTSSETRCGILDSTHDQALCRLQELLDTACRERDGLRGEYAVSAKELAEHREEVTQLRKTQLETNAQMTTLHAHHAVELGNLEVQLEQQRRCIDEERQKAYALQQDQQRGSQKLAELQREKTALETSCEQSKQLVQDETDLARYAFAEMRSVALRLIQLEFARRRSVKLQADYEVSEMNLTEVRRQQENLLVRLKEANSACEETETVSQGLREQLEASRWEVERVKWEKEAERAAAGIKAQSVYLEVEGRNEVLRRANEALLEQQRADREAHQRALTCVEQDLEVARNHAAAEARVVALELAQRALDNELSDAHKDHDKTREKLAQALKDLVQSRHRNGAIAGELAVTIIDLEKLRLEYDVVTKEAKRVPDLEAQVDQQKKCVQNEYEKVRNIDRKLAVRDRWNSELQEANRELRQSHDETKRLVETYKQAAGAAWVRFDGVSEELGGMQRERDWYKEDARQWREKVEAYWPGVERWRADTTWDLQAQLENCRSAWSDGKEMYRKLERQFEEAKKAADWVKAGLEAEKTGLVSKLEVATQGCAKAEEECEALKQSKLAMSDNHTKLQATAFATNIRVVSDLKTKLEGARKDLEVAEEKRQDALLEQLARLNGALSLQLIEPQALIVDLRKEAVKLREDKVTADKRALELEADVSAAKETVREQEAQIAKHHREFAAEQGKIVTLKLQHEEKLGATEAGSTREIAGLEMKLDEKRTEHENLMSASTKQLRDFRECEKKLTECEEKLTESENKLTEREKLRAEAVEEVGKLKRQRDNLQADNSELHKRWDESRTTNSELRTKVEQLEAQCDKAVDNVREEVQCKLDEYEAKFLRLECCAMQLQAERITQLASRSANCEPTPSRESSATVDEVTPGDNEVKPGDNEVKPEENEVKPEGTDVQLQKTDSGEGNGPPTPAHTLSPGPESPASDVSSVNGEQKDDEEEPPTPATTWSSDVSSADGDHEDDQPESPTSGQTLSTPLESPESAVSKVKEEYREDEEIGENINVVQRGFRVLSEVHAQIHEDVPALGYAESRKRKRYQPCRRSQPKCDGKFDFMCVTSRGSKRARLPQGIQPDNAIMGGQSATPDSSPCPIIAGSAELINNAVDLAAALFPSDEGTTQSTIPAEKSPQDGLHTTVKDSTTNLPLIPELVDGCNPPAPAPITRLMQQASRPQKNMARRTPNRRLPRTKTRVTKTSERIFMKP
ncbi:hypothetical protein LTR56_009752 [Elasticomyces elasticus]|nr:hypothetical protein LTR56_009752 [Elasticomyces elasticus]KAK4919171.1 hypothetical protein LTR49_013175 [Elasticomyces elasticus]